MWQSQDFKFFLFFPSSSKQRAATNTEVFLQPGTRTVDLSPGFWIEEMQSHSLLLALSLISFYSISNHCSKTAGTRLPVSLRYRLNNKNRLALKRCCSKTIKKEVFTFGRGEKVSTSREFQTFPCLSIWEARTPPVCEISRRCSLPLTTALLVNFFHPECP